MKTRLLRLKTAYRYIPTCLTLGNTMCGFTAVLFTLQAYRLSQAEVPALLARSAWLIVGAMIFDMADGWTARKLNATSSHGLQMDSLADMVTFGVAPGVMVAVMAHAHRGFEWLSYPWVWLLATIYVFCVTLRLALYNVLAMQHGSSDSFHGLPSPGAAAAVCSLIVLYRTNPDAPLYSQVIEFMPFYAGILGLLMVSPIRYVHISKWLGSRRRHKLKLFMVIVFAMLLIWHPAIVGTIAINLYVLSGPLREAWLRYTKPPTPAMPATPVP
jgi:CDP-diacylglycerol---serine O-phosphatidyltransferase